MYGFFDDVLWFIKVLLALYFSFYLFTFLKLKSEILAWITFSLFTIVIQQLSGKYIGGFATFSIPFFTIGVFASEFKDRNWRFINVSIFPIILYGIIEMMLGTKYTLLLCMIILLIIVTFTLWKPKLVCPAIIASLSFDLYLVHYKVLLVARDINNQLPILEFLILSAITAMTFNYIRTRLLESKRNR